MNYIVFDLEWNQSPNGKMSSEEMMPFEIIQIGAVKLDEQMQEQGEFSAYVSPVAYHKLHRKISDMLGITMDDLYEKGRPFADVCSDFLEWCGEDYVFCIWGSMDLTELQRNMVYHGMENTLEIPLLYYDIQKLYSLQFQDGKERSTLQHVIEEIGIEEDEGFHMADSDARYTAKVMERLDMDMVGKYKSIDTYRIPKSRKDEVYLNFGEYEKFVSRGFSNRDNVVSDRVVRGCKCFKCGKPMKRLVKWFATNSKTYYGLFFCEEHGLVKGRFKVKQTDDDLSYAVRIMKCTDEEGANKIREKQVKEREHRRAVRARQKEKEAAE
jgi:inhibitor of KinA sporulation pathway (predicted exonuclease)